MMRPEVDLLVDLHVLLGFHDGRRLVGVWNHTALNVLGVVGGVFANDLQFLGFSIRALDNGDLDACAGALDELHLSHDDDAIGRESELPADRHGYGSHPYTSAQDNPGDHTASNPPPDASTDPAAPHSGAALATFGATPANGQDPAHDAGK